MMKPVKLSMATAKTYHEEQYANVSNAYYSEAGKVNGYWQGPLAEELGLSAVTKEEYERAMDGQNPVDGEQKIKIRETYKTKEGKEVEHRPGWDLMVSMPKSFSLAALVGGDKRLLQAMREADAEALAITLRLTVQGHSGNQHFNNGKWMVATFEHDTSRPVGGRPDPQIHYHNILPNMVKMDDGKWRSIDPSEIYKAQTLGTALAWWIAAAKARDLGYEIEIGKSGNPEIKGFSAEYLAETSRRSEGIQQRMRDLNISGARAAQIVALSLREEKLDLSPAEFRELMDGLDESFGDQAKRVVTEAKERGRTYSQDPADAKEAVEFGKRRMGERTAVFDHFELLRDAVKYAQGTVPVEAIEQEIAAQIAHGDLVKRTHIREHAPGARYSTKEEIKREREVLEREVIGRVSSGWNTVQAIVEKADLSSYKELADNPKRRQILEAVLEARDQIIAIDGVPGSAKSTSAGILREQIESRGWTVRGMAPTGSAADALRSKGISADTLQMHLKTFGKVPSNTPAETEKRFYILDEASLVSTRQMRKFLRTVRPEDHVLLIGDDSPTRAVGQHTSVESGRVFQMMQEAGMRTAQFNKIYRQKDPELKAVVVHLNNGRTAEAVSLMEDQGRIVEVEDRRKRFAAIGKSYAESPQGTLVVSPDNKSRQEINEAIREAQKTAGNLGQEEYTATVLVARDLTKADATRAWAYQVGDVILYQGGSKELGLEKHSYATVLDRRSNGATRANLLTVKTSDGRELTYDPAAVANVSIYQNRTQSFAAGDRIQMTSRWKEKGLRTRDTGTLLSLDKDGNGILQLDNGRKVPISLSQHRHIDYGYVMTSQSAQSKTVRRVLIHVETMDTRLRGLHNQTFAKVAGSRPEYDLQMYTDSRASLVKELSRPLVKHKALSPEEIKMYRDEAKQEKPIQQEKKPEVQVSVRVQEMPKAAQKQAAITVKAVRTVAPIEVMPRWVRDNEAWRQHVQDLILASSDPFRKLDTADRAALHELADKRISRGLPAIVLTDRQQQLVSLHEGAARVYQENLLGPEGEQARAYLASRGVTPDLVAEFGLGLSGRGKHLVSRLGEYDPDLVEASGLVKTRDSGERYDFFRDRLMFPLQDHDGHVVAFAGRTLEDGRKPKYLNSPSTEIYQKGAMLYNLHRAKDHGAEAGRLVLVEGYMDVIAAHSAGVREAVASTGTAFTEQQAGLMRSVAPSAVLSFDSDRAGREAQGKHIGLLIRSGLSVQGVELAGGKDASAFVQEHGAAAYRYHMAAPKPLAEMLSERAQRSHNVADTYGRIDAMRSMIDALEQVPPERREAVEASLAEYLQVGQNELAQERLMAAMQEQGMSL